MANTVYEVDLGEGRSAAFRKMKVREYMQVFAKAGEPAGGPIAHSFATKLAALELSIVEVDGKPVTYTDLTTAWDDYLDTRETEIMMLAWSQIHEARMGDAVLGKPKKRSGD